MKKKTIKHNVGYYVADPRSQMKPAFEVQEFLDASREIGIENEGWVAEQIFSDTGAIVEYRSIVIDVTTSSSDRILEVEKIYGISPDELFIKGEERYIIFRFRRGINSRAFFEKGQTLCILYNIVYDITKVRTSYPYKVDQTHGLSQSPNLSGKLDSISSWLEDASNKIYDDVANKKEIDKVNTLDKVDILKKLGTLSKEQIDEALDIIVGYGSVYTYVVKTLGGIDSAYEFFNTEYATSFTTGENSIERFMKIGVLSETGELYSQGYSLGYDDKNGFKKITDFIPRVHYRIQRKDTISYIITITGEDGETKRFIEAPNDSSETLLQKWIQGYGNYHITGGKTATTLFHKYLASARVPTIYTVDKFGDIEIQGKRYIAYSDALYEVETGRVINRYPNTPFYMISTIVGIKIEDAGKTDLSEALTIKAPYLGPAKEYSAEEFLKFFSQFYSDDSRYMIPFIASTWLGHLLYQPATSCPMFFVTGPTGSGKTTFTKLLSRIYGIQKPVSLEEATPFPIRFCLTQLDGLPVFFNEYRQKMNYAYEKTQIFKALFDGTPFERGRKDLGIDTFTFSANGFMEGEELPDSGATRTRLVIHKTRVDGIIKGSNPEQKMEENKEFINSFQYSYFQNTDKEEYFFFYEEGKKIFGEISCPSNRVYENICLMYAGVMAFFKDYKQEVIRVLSKLMREQVQDFERNSTGVEFIKAIGQYVGSRFSNVYFTGNSLVLSWNDIVEFIEAKRIKLELGPEGYRDHLQAMGWELDYFEVKGNEFTDEQILIDGIKIPVVKVPLQLRCNPKIYSAYKKFSQKIINN